MKIISLPWKDDFFAPFLPSPLQMCGGTEWFTYQHKLRRLTLCMCVCIKPIAASAVLPDCFRITVFVHEFVF